MWFHVKIIIYVFSIALLPYLLAGIILRFTIPGMKAILVALLATLFIAYLDQEYHFFGNIAKIDNNVFVNTSELEKADFPLYVSLFMVSIPYLTGKLIIQFCFARLGVMLVDKIKIKIKKNTQQEDASNSDSKPETAAVKP